MITNYYRPVTIDEAIRLIQTPDTFVMGGGTILNRASEKHYSVVDLQSLDLNKIQEDKGKLTIGAATTLQMLMEHGLTPPVLKKAISFEEPLNIRNMGSVAGTLISADGRSPFSAVMLALDAKLTITGELSSKINLGDLLPLRMEQLTGKIITQVEIPLNTSIAYEYVARTPYGKPILCTALTRWKSGRYRLVLGGWGNYPVTALDGNDPVGLEEAAVNAVRGSTDIWADEEYRRGISSPLVKRCLAELNQPN